MSDARLKYAERRAAGRCGSCGKRKARKNGAQCSVCAAKARNSSARSFLKAKWLRDPVHACPRCGRDAGCCVVETVCALCIERHIRECKKIEGNPRSGRRSVCLGALHAKHGGYLTDGLTVNVARVGGAS